MRRATLRLASSLDDDFSWIGQHSSPESALAALQRSGKTDLSVAELRKEGYILSLEQWLSRILFLETIAGVPGMVGGMLRHLMSLRLGRRDGGFIHTLLEEAENERVSARCMVRTEQWQRRRC